MEYKASSEQFNQPSRMLKIKEVLNRVGVSRTKVYELVRAGQFPAPVRIGRINLWTEADVNQWITNLVNKSKGVKA